MMAQAGQCISGVFQSNDDIEILFDTSGLDKEMYPVDSPHKGPVMQSFNVHLLLA